MRYALTKIILILLTMFSVVGCSSDNVTEYISEHRDMVFVRYDTGRHSYDRFVFSHGKDMWYMHRAENQKCFENLDTFKVGETYNLYTVMAIDFKSKHGKVVKSVVDYRKVYKTC